MPVRIFDKQIPKEAKIWLYMKRYKFDDMLESNCIRFATVEELRKGDPNEFRYPKQIEDYKDETDQYYNEVTRYASIPPKTRADTQYNWRRDAAANDKLLFVKSWFIGPEEEPEMWRRYAPEAQDVLIQSTIQLLLNSLKDKRLLFCDKIDYGDWNKMVRGPKHGLDRGTYKQEGPYKIESEFRLFLDATLKVLNNKPVEDGFRFVQVDLNTLIERLIVSPKATDEILSSLADSLQKMSLNKRPVHSSLQQD